MCIPSARLVDYIACAEETANPLYVRTLVSGERETLQDRINYYLAVHTVPDLYQRILECYEADYERDRPGLVRDAMSLVWAARQGLSEAELDARSITCVFAIAAAGSSPARLTRIAISAIYLPLFVVGGRIARGSRKKMGERLHFRRLDVQLTAAQN